MLINNAGFGDSGSFADSDWQKQYEMVQLNVIALMQLTHCFLNPMIEQGHGKILNMSSVVPFTAGPYMSIYYATKEFVRSFSEAVAEEVKGTGVTVTAFCPGPTATGFEQAAAMKRRIWSRSGCEKDKGYLFSISIKYRNAASIRWSFRYIKTMSSSEYGSSRGNSCIIP